MFNLLNYLKELKEQGGIKRLSSKETRQLFDDLREYKNKYFVFYDYIMKEDYKDITQDQAEDLIKAGMIIEYITIETDYNIKVSITYSI